jgi:hypothetical protein
MSKSKFKVVGRKEGEISHLAKVGVLGILTNGKTVCGLNAILMGSGERYFWPQQVSCKRCRRTVLR